MENPKNRMAKATTRKRKKPAGRPKKHTEPVVPKKIVTVTCRRCGKTEKRRIRYTRGGFAFHCCTGCGEWYPVQKD